MAVSRDNKTGSEQYHAFMVRVLRSYATRAREGALDIDALTQLADLQRMLDLQTGEVARALAADGFSWQQIGDALGKDRGNAHRQYARPPV